MESIPERRRGQAETPDADKVSELDRQTEPEARAEQLLRHIEAERFATKDDPGIHGIKQRLQALGFVSVTPECCSGHPEEKEFKDSVTGALHVSTFGTPGYMYIRFSPDDSRSELLYDALRKIEVRGFNCGAAFLTYRGFVPFRDIEPLVYEHRSRPEKSVGFDVAIRGTSAQEIAVALRDFWTKVSETLNQFEPSPIREKLESWYFAFKSDYGTMKLTHPTFQSYEEEVKKRSK